MGSPAREKLSRDGYLIAREYLNADALDNLRAISRDVLDILPREQFKTSGGRYNVSSYAAFAEIIALPDSGKVMAELGLASYKWGGAHLISRPGYSPPQFWHQDWWGWSNGVSYHEKPLVLDFIYHLSDTRWESGCLRVIPGSHQFWHELHQLPEVRDEGPSWSEHRENIASQSHHDEVAILVNPGDLVIMDNRLLRSAYANASNEEQSMLILSYLPEFETMPFPIQHRFSRLFAQLENDRSSRKKGRKSPFDWPEEKRAIARHLFPQGSTSAPAEPINRKPARVRMLER